MVDSMIRLALRTLPAAMGLALGVVAAAALTQVDPTTLLLFSSPAFLGALVAWFVLARSEVGSKQSATPVGNRTKWVVALALVDLVFGLALLAMDLLVPSAILISGGGVLVIGLRTTRS